MYNIIKHIIRKIYLSIIYSNFTYTTIRRAVKRKAIVTFWIIYYLEIYARTTTTKLDFLQCYTESLWDIRVWIYKVNDIIENLLFWLLSKGCWIRLPLKVFS